VAVFIFTKVAPVKLVPVIVITVPAGPVVGVKLVMVGMDAVTVKLVAEAAVPPGVVTRIKPVVEPDATVAVICVALFMVKDVAAVLLKDTAVAPVKLVPVMVTEVPTGPLVGVKLVMVGAATGTILLIKMAALASGDVPP
jgi:hypothetical protein